MKAVSISISVLLIPLVVMMPLRAEMAAAVPLVLTPIPEATVPSTPTPSEAGSLQIRLAESGSTEVEVNSIATGYSIVVTDASGIPVAGAAVAVRLPEDAPTGFFVDGAHSAVAYTDVSGIAKFAKIHWSSKPGIVSIRVTAVKGNLHAGAVMDQNLVAHPGAAVQARTELQKLPQPQSETANSPGPPTPGTPVSISSVHSGAAGEDSAIRPAQTSASADPAVTVVNTPGITGGSHGGKKWILIAVAAAGAGIGAALALGIGGKASAATSASSTGVTIGSPTVSVGH